MSNVLENDLGAFRTAQYPARTVSLRELHAVNPPVVRIPKKQNALLVVGTELASNHKDIRAFAGWHALPINTTTERSIGIRIQESGFLFLTDFVNVSVGEGVAPQQGKPAVGACQIALSHRRERWLSGNDM